MPAKNSNQDMIIEELRLIQSDVKEIAAVKGDIKRIEEVLIRIETQVTKTNGRVSSLEAWRNRIVGAMGVIGAILGYLATAMIK